jgi:hypothetical protein
MRRFLYFALLVAGTVGLLACDQAEPSGTTAAGIKAERVAQPSVPITVTTSATDKVNGIRPKVATPATKAPTLGLTNWAETYEPAETEEFVVNEHTLGNQKAPAIACNRAVQNWFYGSTSGYEARGACIVAWESYGEAGAGALHDIYARRLINVEYTLDANVARDVYDTAAWHVNDGTGHATGEQLNPAVAVTPDNDEGGYVVVWESNNMDPDNIGYGVFGQRYDKDDAKVDAAFLINTTVANDQLNADVAMDDNGNFVVVWQSLDEVGEINTGIYLKAYDSSGSPTAQFHVNEWTTGTQDHPAVTMDDAGNVVVAWHSSQLNAGKDVYARALKFTAATKTISDWTSEFLVNTTTAANQQFADLGIADDGTIVVTWEGFVGGSYDAYYQQLEVAAGPALAKKTGQTETVVNAYTTGDQRKPQIIVDPNGKFVVAYQSEDGQDGDDAGVYYQRFAADGTAHFDEGSQATLVNTEKTVNIQERPAIALLRMESEQYAAQTLENAPSFIVAYHSKGQTPQDGAAGDYGIFARRFSVDHDGDGRGLDGDNCKYVAHTYQADSNPAQGDVDQDLMGDVCDNCASDTACEKVAKDEVIANFCTITGTDTINYDQTDTDGDTIGDVCDTCPGGINSTAWVDYATSVNDDTTQVDYDSDGIGDFCDTDDDADNVPDIHEDGNNGNDNPDSDTDGGTAAWISRHDTDSDGDSILDFVEYDWTAAACDQEIQTESGLVSTAAPADHDCDGDTLLNNYDTDADNDDIPDLFEFDADIEGMALGDAPINTDGDAYGDWLDSDSNNDNIGDYRKVHDANLSVLGYAAKGVDQWDWDDDSFSDHIDPDMDGDGVTDTDENGEADSDCTYPVGQEEAYRNRDNSDLAADTANFGDNDGDGTDGDNDDWLWNWQDLDSDGDGVLDSVEKIDDGIDGDGHCAEVDYDSDGDGILDDHESGTDMPAGIDDDVDDDLAVNSLDTDADADGVMDAIEWANGCGDGADSPAYPHDDMPTTPAADERDCDGDGKENWYDDDSDADGISDAHESGNEMPAGMDGGAGSICGGNTGTINWMAGLPAPLAFLSSTFQDCDDDGFVNSQDYDADADGVNDLVETSANIETPVDGAENWFDGDSDGDTMTDAHESGVDRDPCVDLSASYKMIAPFNVDERYRLAICDVPPTPNMIPQDIDSDGAVNSQDFDADNDGVLDYDENNTAHGDDIDSDGVENWWDLDSDADWITDLHESGLEATAAAPTLTKDATGRYPYVQHDIEASVTNGDFDGDGKLNCHDFDSDGDGVADITEWKNNEANDHNLDQDDYENWADDDSDGDGIPDAHESGTEAGGTIPANLSTGAPSICIGNAVPAAPIAPLATTVTQFFMTNKWQDCDGDNLISSLDTDADADGVLDNLEWYTTAEDELNELHCDDEIPNFLNQNDCDGDTVENWYDGDSDEDGMTDAHESGNDMDAQLTLTHCQGLTFNDTYQLATATDCDGDGYLNTQDSDADGDGILDVEEGATYTELTNGCAKVPSDDGLEPWFDGDTDGDRILDKVETDSDLDGDGTKNYKDCDSDADTIADWHELDDNSDNDSDMNFLDEDSDNDGIPDQWECDQAVLDGEGACDPAIGGYSWTPNDTDGDTIADYRDIDSDADGNLDAHENGETIPDTITDVYCQGIVQVVNAGVATRHDCDGDGIHNYRDEDSDNDGVGDIVEWANEELVNEDATKSIERDQDGDELEGWYDMDSDGDGIADVTEKLEVQPAGTVVLIAQLDSDGDGIVNSFDLDSDADYISDEHQCAMGQACECTAGPCVLTHKAPDPDAGADIDTPWDTDGDGTSDYLDDDSDADGVDDLVEAGDTSLATAPLNTDADNWDDYLDTEADGDGWLDDVDNCPTIYNEDQDDLDTDGVGDACDQDFHDCLEVAEDATFTVTSPTDYTPGLTSVDADTLSVPFVFEYTGQNAKGLYVYIDDSLYALYKPVPASPLSVDVPFGQHRIGFELSDSNGTPFNGCIDARDTVKLRVSKNCVLLEDCSDGNICSNETCSNGTCSFGDDPTHPQCCNSDYDCAYNDMCMNKLGDTVKECIQCNYDDAGGADNCAQQDCKDAVCNDDYTCGFDSDPTCCFNDLGCANYPCETCTIDEATGKGSCEKSDYATDLETEGKQCCMQAADPMGSPTWGCAESPNDVCTVEACLGNVCRYGPTFFGCCSENADCADATKLNVCNAGTGTCVLDGGTGTCSYAANGDHQDCCFSNIDCIRALIEDKVAGYDVATSCLGNGDCGGDYTICHGAQGATTQGKCAHHCVTNYDCANFDADYPTCLIADGDTEGVCGKSYPKYLAHCGGDGEGDDSAFTVDPDGTPLSGDEWEKCEYVENPLTCTVPDGVSQVVINELMVTPQLAATEAAGQWIELFNPGSSVVDIYGWIIDDSNNPADPAAGNAIKPVQVSTTACNTDDDCPDERYAICNVDGGAPGICEGPAPAVILPGRMFVICRSDSDLATNGDVSCDYTMANGALWSLDTVGDTITLWAPDGEGKAVDPPIDTVIYTNAKLTNGQGYSLSLSHPYTSNATDLHWFSYTPNARLSYNGTDFGTPGQINSDVFEKTLIDADLPGTYIDVCDDGGKDCTLGVCNLNAPEFCGQVTLEGCCTSTGVAGSAQCSDGDVCTTDACNQATYMCDNSVPMDDCCNANAECSDWYPDNFDTDVDLVAPIGNITAADADAVRDTFDEIVDKKCIANTCRFRKKPATAAGCVSMDYSNALFACEDNNPCTQNQCLCSTGDPADCRNADYTDGYYACDYTDPVEIGDTCCYDDTDCDDLDPTTLDECDEHLDGVEHFECSNDPDPNYCVTAATCDDSNPCTDDTCSAENRCVFTANATKVEAGCCAGDPTSLHPHAGCIDHEILTEGLNKPFTIDVCCLAGDGSAGSGDAVGVNPTLDELCDDAIVGVEYSQCIHATGDDFCETAADCLTQQPVGKKCLTSYCIANRCRFGTPLLDAGDLGPDFPVGAKCCEDNADCNDANECTTESCTSISGLDVGYCDIQNDASKPECCQTTPDCCDPDPGCDPVTEDCCTEDCVKTSCSFDNTKGYRYCKEHDLLGLGLCCTENGDCDDLNSCTLDTCNNSLCRHTTPIAGCCENVGMCPVTGDQCATRACDVPGGADNDTCALAAVPNCVATMPYIQDFEFAKSFYNSYDDIDVLNWVGSGDNADKWIPSTDSTEGLGSDKHLRLWDNAGNLDITDGSCVRLPRINTTGNDAAVITWWHEVNLAPTQPVGSVTLRVKARKDTNDVYEDIWSQIAVDETMDFYAAIPEADLLSGTTELQFCIESGSLIQGSYWAIDDVKVVRGRIPILLTTLTDKVVNAGADLLIQDIEAYDQDYDTVVFSLVDAPGFVTLDNFHLTPVGPINHAFVDIQVTDAECNEALNNVYEIKLKVSDGYLNVYETFNLSITGCIQ